MRTCKSHESILSWFTHECYVENLRIRSLYTYTMWYKLCIKLYQFIWFSLQLLVQNMTILVITSSGETQNAMGNDNDRNWSLLSNMQVLIGTHDCHICMNDHVYLNLGICTGGTNQNTGDNYYIRGLNQQQATIRAANNQQRSRDTGNHKGNTTVG